MPSRRSYLAQTGLAAAALGGCVSFGGDRTGDEEKVEPLTRLGGAQPVAAEARPETDYRYLPERDSVQVYLESGTEIVPFAEWADGRAKVQAAHHVGSLLARQSLLVDGVSTGTRRVSLDELADSTPPAGTTPIAFDRPVGTVPLVRYQYLYDRDGDLVSKPAVAFEEVVAATPRAVTMTLLVADREYTTTVPVVCDRSWLQYD